ncbi:MAG: hypothetical protein GC152_02790 [Alphaproteobacteria bacterium]|nr:hypothetical protein [Alphaproteobacteria bacterium]
MATAAAFAAAAPPAAQAQGSGSLIFNGLIPDACILLITTPGVLAPNATNTELSSQETGGSPALATLTTTSTNFEVQVDPASAFSVEPTGGGTNVSFSVDYSLAGVTILSDILAGVGSPLGFGITFATVDAAAIKSSGAFPAGAYQLQTTIRCVSS